MCGLLLASTSSSTSTAWTRSVVLCELNLLKRRGSFARSTQDAAQVLLGRSSAGRAVTRPSTALASGQQACWDALHVNVVDAVLLVRWTFISTGPVR